MTEQPADDPFHDCELGPEAILGTRTFEDVLFPMGEHPLKRTNSAIAMISLTIRNTLLNSASIFKNGLLADSIGVGNCFDNCFPCNGRFGSMTSTELG